MARRVWWQLGLRSLPLLLAALWLFVMLRAMRSTGEPGRLMLLLVPVYVLGPIVAFFLAAEIDQAHPGGWAVGAFFFPPIVLVILPFVGIEPSMILLERRQEARDVRGLTRSLRSSDLLARKRAAESLGRIGDAAAVPALIRALGDRSPDVAAAAAESLGRLGDRAATAPLLRLLGRPGSLLAGAATDALGRLADPAAVEPLLALLPGADEVLAWGVMDALGKLGAAGAVPAIQQKARELRTERAYTAAAGALDRLGAKELADAFRAAIQREPEREPRHRGALGEPYCSDECYRKGTQLALLELAGASCSSCGSPIRSRPGNRGYAVIPQGGKAFIACAACIPAVQARVRTEDRCRVCSGPL